MAAHDEQDWAEGLACEDDADLAARLEAAYREERARIRCCFDPGELRELMEVYQEQIEAGELPGLAGQRARDLIQRADARLGALAAAQHARVERARAAEEREAEAARRRRDQAREAGERRRAAEHERVARERAWKAEEAERIAAARLASAKAAEVEARAALLRARADQIARSRTDRSLAADQGEPALEKGRGAGPRGRSPREQGEVPSAAGGTSITSIEEADRAALMAVGRWPPPEPRPESLLWRAEDHWPSTWKVTGFDLAMFRGALKVTQRVFAAQLGVPTTEVAKAEANPREKVRPALQVAMLRAVQEHRGRRRSSEAGGGSGGVAEVEAREAELTGADLANFRASSGLTQRQAAALLGVAHGTVAKAELAADKALGEQLAMALKVVGRG